MFCKRRGGFRGRADGSGGWGRRRLVVGGLFGGRGRLGGGGRETSPHCFEVEGVMCACQVEEVWG